jgi:hypothetical protein
MTEADLKRYLVRSMRFQGGVGERIEDRYKVGWPDLIFVPPEIPVIFAEAKMLKTIRTPRLTCTATQEQKLLELIRPPHAYSALLGYHLPTERLYAGYPDWPIDQCVSIARPARLDSPHWDICVLLADLLKSAFD